MEFKTDFAETLLNWYRQKSRHLPWRETTDPYRIWLSEIILQQTRVEQGKPYYEAFIRAFPQVHDLARAEETDVLKLWQGLGYYSRARNLHQTAKVVSMQHRGSFPATSAELLRLKGIGAYTAAAIASICFDEKVPVVDGNVYRFISRFAGIEEPIGTPRAHRLFSEFLLNLMPDKGTGAFNQALMEFGALQCTPQNPDCLSCPFIDTCVARLEGKISSLPVKAAKTVVKPVFFNFLDLRFGERRYLTQRIDPGIWKKLFHFPLLESQEPWTEPELLAAAANWLGVPGGDLSLKRRWTTIHLLSHRRIDARFWEIHLARSAEKSGIFEIEADELDKYPIPRLMEKYLEHVSK